MASIAELGVVAKATGVKETGQDLEKLATAADKAEVASGKLTAKSNSLSGGMGVLAGALGRVAIAMSAAFSVGALTGIADEWSDLTSRVNLASGSIERGTVVMGRLQKMANATYSSLRTTTEGYIANAAILRGMGKSTKETLDYTEALNNAMVVSGARAERAASVQNALSKAMSLGKLSGDNLNTVLQQGGRVAELLAEKLGTTVPGLVAMGAQGKITGDIITEALIGNMQKLAEEAEEMPATIGDAFQRMQNNMLSSIGTFDQMFGASESVAGALLTVADNLERIIVTVGTAAVGFGTYYVGALVASAVATGSLTAALRTLRAALISTGIGALVVVVGELVYMLLQARKATESWGEAFVAVAKRLENIWQGIKYAWYFLINFMRSQWFDFLANAVAGAQKAANAIGSIFGKSFTVFDDAIDDFNAKASDYAEAAGTYAEGAAAKFREAFAEFDKSTDVSLGDDAGGGGALGGVGSGGGGGGAKGGGGKDRTTRDMESRLEALKQSLASENEARLQAYVKDMETLNWYLDNKKMTEEEYNIWKQRVEEEAFEKTLTDQEKLIADHERELEALKLFFDQKKLTEEEFLRWQKEINEQHARDMQAINLMMWSDALGSMGDVMGAMASLQGSNNEKMLKAQRIFGAASALISTYVGAAEALKLGFPQNLAAAAAILAKGMSFVAAIKSGSKSGGSGGGASIPKQQSAAPPQQKPINTQAVEIKLEGDNYSRASVEKLMEQMNELSSDGFKLIIGTS